MKRNNKGEFTEVKKKKVICPQCGTEHELYPSDYNRGRRFCSRECSRRHKSENLEGKNHHRYNRKKSRCKVCDEKFSHIPSKDRAYCSKSCSNKDRDYPTGKNNPNWKGGKTSKIRKLRNSKKYGKWRKKVFERDNYACQKCGAKDKFLHAHHIVPVSQNIELIFDLSNGETLCADCHQEKHPDLNLSLEVCEDNSNDA